jgi:hypothetical protein
VLVSATDGTGVIDTGHSLDDVLAQVASYENDLRGNTFDALSRQSDESLTETRNHTLSNVNCMAAGEPLEIGTGTRDRSG